MKTPLVVLGCRLTVRGNPPRLVGVARRRCDRALERYVAAGPRMVVVAGGRAWDGLVEADAFADELCHGGVARTDIVRERCSHSTGENARYAAELLRRHGTRAIELVTSASQRVARHRLASAGLPLPRLLIGAEDVVRGKPDPEPYLLAARQLGLAPADCLVFEDAPAGIRSALQAGCQVVQIGGDKRLDGGVRARLEDWRQIRLTEDEAGLQLCMANLLPD